MRMMAQITMDGTTLAVAGGVGVAVLGVIYFGIRFWLISTRPADIREVETPNLDRLNRAALESMGESSGAEEEGDGEDEAPAELKSIVPPPEAPEA
jgi:hypothetical protein